jgi:hypothetical protein
MTRLLRSALLLLCAAPTVAAAQATSSAAGPAREREVLAVVQRLFDGMRAGDSAAVRATFHPAAQLMSVGGKGGVPALEVDSLDQFLRVVGKPHPEPYDERTSNPRVHIDGDLAAVWTDYAFFVGDKFSHCGVDAFHLFRGPDGWKIISLADTRRREGCAQGPVK